MSLPIGFRREAGFEFDEAARWYNNREQGLGDDFVLEVRRVLDDIAAHPRKHPEVLDDGMREAEVRRFPYAIYYRVIGRRIMVASVFHQSRDPAIWQSR